jgi:hypothetical protein
MKRSGQWVSFSLVGFFMFFLAIGSCALWFAFRPSQVLHIRLMMFSAAALALALPARAAWVVLRRKRKTGQWSISDEERQKWLAKNAEAKAKKPAWLRYVPSWLRNDTRDPQGMILSFAITFTPIAIINIVMAYRRHFDAFDCFIAALWVLLVSFCIGNLLRKPRAVSTSPDPRS